MSHACLDDPNVSRGAEDDFQKMQVLDKVWAQSCALCDEKVENSCCDELSSFDRR